MTQASVFTIRYIAPNGHRSTMNIQATGKTEARAQAIEGGMPESRILMISREFAWKEWIRTLQEEKTGDIERMLIYTQMSALIAAGSPTSQIEELVTSMRKNTPKIGDSNISAWLRGMGFPNTELAAIEAAESSGQLADGLSDAAEQLMLHLRIKKDTGKQFTMAAIVFVMAVVSLLAMPITTGGTLDMIEKQLANPRMSIQTTFVTDILFWQRDLYKAIPLLPLLLPLSIAAIGYRWRKQFLKTPVFQAVDKMQKAALSSRFLLAWRPLYKAGIPVRTAIRQAGGVLPPEVAEIMVDQINRGGALSNALLDTESHWSRTLVIGLKGADDIVGDLKTALIEKLIFALSLEQSTQAAVAARTLYLFAALVAVATIFGQLFGAMLPMMTMGVG